MKRLLFVPFIALSLWAEDAPKVNPALNDKQIIEYLKAALDATQAQLNACQSPAKLQTVVQDLQKVCPLMLGADGLPVCVPPPVVAPKVKGPAASGIVK